MGRQQEWERERRRKRAVRIAHRQQVCRDGGPGGCALRGSACGHVHQLGPRRGRAPGLRYSRPRELRRQLQLSALHADIALGATRGIRTAGLAGSL